MRIADWLALSVVIHSDSSYCSEKFIWALERRGRSTFKEAPVGAAICGQQGRRRIQHMHSQRQALPCCLQGILPKLHAIPESHCPAAEPHALLHGDVLMKNPNEGRKWSPN